MTTNNAWKAQLASIVKRVLQPPAPRYETPTHPLTGDWTPSGCHPVIAAIPNWREKVKWPWPRAARLRRHMLKRGLDIGLPRPLNVSSKTGSEWESVLNGVRSNISVPGATSYWLPIYNPVTRHHVKNPDRNEFWDKPELLLLVGHKGRVTQRDYKRLNLPTISRD